MLKFDGYGCDLFPESFLRAVRLDSKPPRWGAACSSEAVLFMGCLARLVTGPIVEFGTFTGNTTYNMALNTSSKIYTIDSGVDIDVSKESGYGPYIPGEIFKGHLGSDRIELIIGDSRGVDLSRLYGTVGLVFIDGGHSREVVESDTDTALRLIRSDGLIVWDDYDRYWSGVVDTVQSRSDLHERMLYIEKDSRMLYWGPQAPVKFAVAKEAA